jgi:hypothetical protein
MAKYKPNLDICCSHGAPARMKKLSTEAIVMAIRTSRNGDKTSLSVVIIASISFSLRSQGATFG